MERLQRLYGAVGRKLRRTLLSVEPSSYTDAKAAEARETARQLVRTLNAGAQVWAERAIAAAYMKSAREARAMLEILGRRPRRGPISDSTVKLSSDLMVILMRANNSIMSTVDRYLAVTAMAARQVQGAMLREFEYAAAAADIEGMAAEAVAQEASRGKLAADVRDYLRDLVVDDQFIQIGDRMYRMKKYAEMVSRTTLREAQTAATLDLCEQYENDLVQWSDHGTDCEICKPFEGQIYSRSGRHPYYPYLEAVPPHDTHPNCMHSLLPTSDIEIAAIERYGGGQPLRERPS